MAMVMGKVWGCAGTVGRAVPVLLVMLASAMALSVPAAGAGGERTESVKGSSAARSGSIPHRKVMPRVLRGVWMPGLKPCVLPLPMDNFAMTITRHHAYPYEDDWTLLDIWKISNRPAAWWVKTSSLADEGFIERRIFVLDDGVLTITDGSYSGRHTRCRHSQLQGKGAES